MNAEIHSTRHAEFPITRVLLDLYDFNLCVTSGRTGRRPGVVMLLVVSSSLRERMNYIMWQMCPGKRLFECFRF